MNKARVSTTAGAMGVLPNLGIATTQMLVLPASYWKSRLSWVHHVWLNNSIICETIQCMSFYEKTLERMRNNPRD